MRVRARIWSGQNAGAFRQIVVAITIFRDNFLHLCANRGSAVDGQDGSELNQMARQIVPAMRCAMNLPDLRERRRMNFFGRVRKFFEKLLAVAQAGKANAYFVLGLSGETDQSFCQVKNAHRLAHIEQQGVAVVSNGETLQNQRDRLACGHEESHDIRVRDRELLVISNLFLKYGDDTPT